MMMHKINGQKHRLPFISVWRTTTPGETVELPIDNTADNLGHIVWGDGTITPNTYANRSHVYAVAGDYTVEIHGWTTNFSTSTTKAKLIEVSQFGSMQFIKAAAFSYYANLNITATDIPNMGTDLSNVFIGDSSLIFNSSINSWNVVDVTTMYAMFRNSLFNKPIGNWNVGNVNVMNRMFRQSLFNQPIGNWDVSNVTDMYAMFRQALFNQPIGNWDVSNVTDMIGMFYLNTAFNQNIGNWDFTKVASLRIFMEGKSSANYDAANYDALLANWAANGAMATGITCNMGTIKFTAAAQADRDYLVNVRGWIITDGGVV